MKPKQWALVIFLLFLSTILGFTLSNLDFFGFLSAKHTLSFVFLFSSLIIWYLLLFTVFLLEFSEAHHVLIVAWAATLLFSVADFFVHLQPLLILLNSLFFFSFLVYGYYTIQKRAYLFLKFSSQQIFVPIMKRGFMFVIILLALASYFQTVERIKENTLLGPAVIRPISRPIVALVNKQLTSQIRTQIEQVPSPLRIVSTEQITRIAISQFVSVLTDSGKKDFLGLPGTMIDSNKIAISPQGDVDIEPLVEDLLPKIAQRADSQLGIFASFIPLVIAVVVVLFLQPILYLFELFLYIPTPIIFKLLLATGFAHLEKETVEREKLVI